MNDKLIMKDGKPHKIAQVVMLPTNDQTQIAKGHDNNRFIYADKPMSDTQNNRAGYMNQHLYILSSEEIKEGEYGINLASGSIFKLLDKSDSKHWKVKFITGGNMSGEIVLEDWSHANPKKIIATTDESLKIDVKSELAMNKILIRPTALPRTSDDFLKAFVKANGKIDKVLVEYQEIQKCLYEYPKACENSECRVLNKCREEERLQTLYYKLKVSPDNTITIRTVEGEKKDYGIEYLKFIATRFAHECRLKDVVSNHETCTLFDKWIKENL